MYNPLHPFLTIRDSVIHGQGVFAIRDIPIDFNLGVTHIYDDRFFNNYSRTPLGGFVNHSETPNCELYECGDYLKMKTSKLIEAGEELTLTYSLYDPCKNYKCDSDN